MPDLEPEGIVAAHFPPCRSGLAEPLRDSVEGGGSFPLSIPLALEVAYA